MAATILYSPPTKSRTDVKALSEKKNSRDETQILRHTAGRKRLLRHFFISRVMVKSRNDAKVNTSVRAELPIYVSTVSHRRNVKPTVQKGLFIYYSRSSKRRILALTFLSSPDCSFLMISTIRSLIGVGTPHFLPHSQTTPLIASTSQGLPALRS